MGSCEGYSKCRGPASAKLADPLHQLLPVNPTEAARHVHNTRRQQLTKGARKAQPEARTFAFAGGPVVINNILLARPEKAYRKCLSTQGEGAVGDKRIPNPILLFRSYIISNYNYLIVGLSLRARAPRGACSPARLRLEPFCNAPISSRTFASVTFPTEPPA